MKINTTPEINPLPSNLVIFEDEGNNNKQMLTHKLLIKNHVVKELIKLGVA